MPSRNSEDDVPISSRAHRSKGFLKDLEWRGRGGRFMEARRARRAGWLSSAMAFEVGGGVGDARDGRLHQRQLSPDASIAASTPPESQAESPSPVQCPWPMAGTAWPSCRLYVHHQCFPTHAHDSLAPCRVGKLRRLAGRFPPTAGHVAGVYPDEATDVGGCTSVGSRDTEMRGGPRCAQLAQLARYLRVATKSWRRRPPNR